MAGWLTRDIVFHALVVGAQENDEEASHAALAKVDAVVRRFARKRFRELVDAERMDAREEDRHVLARAAFRAVKRIPEAKLSDADGLQEELKALVAELKPRARRGPPLAIILPVLLLAFTIGGPLGWWLTRPFDPLKTPEGDLLGTVMTDFQVAASQGQPEAKGLRDRLVGDEGNATLGSAVANRLARLLEIRREVEKGEEDAVGRFAKAATETNRALAESELPYFVDTTVLSGRNGLLPVIYTYYVQRRVSYRAGEQDVDVLQLWRLDRMNLYKSALGYTSPTMEQGVVLLDQLESNLVTVLLPALSQGEHVALFDDDAKPAPWHDDIQASAAAAVREQLTDIPSEHAEGARRVGELLARRRRLIEGWRDSLLKSGKRLRIPERLIPEADYTEQLWLLVPSSERYEWDDLHGELIASAQLEAFVHLRQRLAVTVQRHELQHRLDHLRGALPVPKLMVELLGEARASATEPRSLGVRAREETSAYLASMTLEQSDPKLTLVLLSRSFFAGSSRIYRYAALAVYMAVAEAAGIDLQRLRDARFRPRAVAELMAEVLGKPGPELQQAAVKAYATLFGRPAESVQITAETETPPWRH